MLGNAPAALHKQQMSMDARTWRSDLCAPSTVWEYCQSIDGFGFWCSTLWCIVDFICTELNFCKKKIRSDSWCANHAFFIFDSMNESPETVCSLISCLTGIIYDGKYQSFQLTDIVFLMFLEKWFVGDTHSRRFHAASSNFTTEVCNLAFWGKKCTIRTCLQGKNAITLEKPGESFCFVTYPIENQ